MTELTGLLFSFEAQHIFARSLYNGPQIAAFLEDQGYEKHMLGNRRSLFSSLDAGNRLADGS